MHEDPRSVCLAILALATAISAQAEAGPDPVAEPKLSAGAKLITEKRVTEVVSFLASDELAGRDTPSRGLEKAAAYIAAAFEKAGLRPLTKKGGYFHTYEKPGVIVDSAGVKIVLHMTDSERAVALRPGKDVRVYRAPRRAFAREDTGVTVVDERRAGRRLRRSAARDPILVLVDPKGSALWKAITGERRVFARRRLSRAPVLLVRKGAMPKGAIDYAEVEVAAAKQVTLQLKNVVAVLPGGKKKNEFVVFSAHYDHIGVGLPVNGDGVFNGADDDATGTTAVVTLAEAFARAGRTTERSLLFICFSGEEKGLVGSRAFARQPPVPLRDIAVDLNLEMLGRPDQIKPRQAWVTGRELSDFEEIAKIGFARAGIECVEFPRARVLFTASDNAPLAREGVVAHSISAGSLHGDYHRPSDHVKKLDLPHMTAVIRGIYEAGLEFANRDARPAYNDRGRRALRLDR